jgi:hypothetical protein
MDRPKDTKSGLSAITCLRINTLGATGTICPRWVPGHRKKSNGVAKWAKNPREENTEEGHSQG